MFPVYSSKLPCDARLPPEIDHLCLLCVYSLCSSLGSPVLSALYHWVPHVESEVDTCYIPLYSEEEAEKIAASIPQKTLEANDLHTDRCARQLLARLGVSAGQV